MRCNDATKRAASQMLARTQTHILRIENVFKALSQWRTYFAESYTPYSHCQSTRRDGNTLL